MDFSSIATFLKEFFAEVDTTGIQDLILALAKWAYSFDIREGLGSDTTAQLLTTFSSVWNPIWEYVVQLLKDYNILAQ